MHVEFGKDCKLAFAHAYDFKTDKAVVDLHERYSDQIVTYTKAAAMLLGISAEKVTAEPLSVRQSAS